MTTFQARIANRIGHTAGSREEGIGSSCGPWTTVWVAGKKLLWFWQWIHT